MARASLFQSKKFKRLVAQLGIPRPYVVGLLETMWHACYETGDPVFTDREEIEAAAEWPGTPGTFSKSSISVGLIDAITTKDGKPGYEIHDFWDHAPKSVGARREREEARKTPRVCQQCGVRYYLSDPRSKFCTNACKQKNYRENVTDRVTDRSVTVTECYTTPDTRHPTPDTRHPTPKYTTTSGAGASEGNTDWVDRQLDLAPDGESANRAIGHEPGENLNGSGDRLPAASPSGDRPDTDSLEDSSLDAEIRGYIGRHPFLTYDLKTHKNVRMLVERLGWGKTEELVNRGAREGKKFPAGWAVGCLAGLEQEEGALSVRAVGPSPPKRKSKAEKSEEALQQAFAELDAERLDKS